jgi:LysM repeat protein
MGGRIDGSFNQNILPSSSQQHTVQQGETFESISQQYGISAAALRQTNQQLRTDADLNAGLILLLPETIQRPPTDQIATFSDTLQVGGEDLFLENVVPPHNHGGPDPNNPNSILMPPSDRQESLNLPDLPNLPLKAENVPDNFQSLLDLLPPSMDQWDLLNAIKQQFPELDANHDGTLTWSEVQQSMDSWKFPPIDLTSNDGKRFLQLLTSLDPLLQTLVGDLAQSQNPEDYAVVMKQVTARVVQLLQALYQGSPVTIEDVSQPNHWGCDDILVNGVPVSLTHQTNTWEETEGWLDSMTTFNLWDPHVGSDVAQYGADGTIHAPEKQAALEAQPDDQSQKEVKSWLQILLDKIF